MRTVAYLRWNPPTSSMRVEFLPTLLNELESDPSGHGWGVLYGTRHTAELRLLAARRQPDDADPNLATWAVLGLYFRRPRGEVFLTESDLGKFLASGADVALVVCGNRGGFFIREPDGTVDSLSSPEEFALPVPGQKVASKPVFHQPVVAQGAPRPVTRPPPRSPKRQHNKPRREPSQKSGFTWGWATAAAFLMLAIPLGAVAFLRPLLPQPLALSLKEEAGHILITWNPRASLEGGKLEIADGARMSVLNIRPWQRTATLQPLNREVTVTVASNPSLGRYLSETATLHVTGLRAPAPPRISVTAEELATLEKEVEDLQAGADSSHRQADTLELAIERLMDRIHANPALLRK